METLTRPPLRWHGSKWKLAPWIVRHFPPHRVYVEPWGGSAAVLLRKKPSFAEVYNDLDGDVVTLFEVLRSDRLRAQLLRKLQFTPWSRLEYERAYEPARSPVERARRLLIRSWMGFGSGAATQATFRHAGGGFRAAMHKGSRGHSVRNDWERLPACLRAVGERLRWVVLENRDALEIIRQQDTPETLVYADPPYPHSVREDVRADYRYEMSDDDHRRMAEVLRGLQGMVVLSGYPSALYDELFPDWDQVERTARVDSGAARQEVLWLNPAAAARQPAPTLFTSQPGHEPAARGEDQRSP